VLARALVAVPYGKDGDEVGARRKPAACHAPHPLAQEIDLVFVA
jgi:hypothetical protein